MSNGVELTLQPRNTLLSPKWLIFDLLSFCKDVVYLLLDHVVDELTHYFGIIQYFLTYIHCNLLRIIAPATSESSVFDWASTLFLNEKVQYFDQFN